MRGRLHLYIFLYFPSKNRRNWMLHVFCLRSVFKRHDIWLKRKQRHFTFCPIVSGKDFFSSGFHIFKYLLLRDISFKIVLSDFIGKGQAKYVNKTVKNDSFFNFFAPPEGTVKCDHHAFFEHPGSWVFCSLTYFGCTIYRCGIPSPYISEKRVSPIGNQTT
jgi:hypothetical protein